MFHVKRARKHAIASDKRYAPWLLAAWVGVLTGIAPFSARAGISKCTDPSGKIVFSDSPCADSQAAAAVKPAVKTPNFKGSLADKQDVCRKLTGDFYAALDDYSFSTKPKRTDAELKTMLKTIDEKCKGVEKPEDTSVVKPQPRHVVSKSPLRTDQHCATEASWLDYAESSNKILSYSDRQSLNRNKADFEKSCEYK